MPTPPPSTDHYQVGGAIVLLSGLDLGNIVSLEIDPTDLEILEHFTSRSGARKVDLRVVVQKRLLFRMGLDEHAKELYKKYFMGSESGTTVFPLTQPLGETNILITYRNEASVIWTYSHTRVNTRPSGAMDFGEFDAFVGYEVEIEALFDVAAVGAELGRFVFV